jgi:hypothetical protein
VIWQPIATLPDVDDMPDHLLLWNAGDGPHLFWLLAADRRELEQAKTSGIYTAWCEVSEPKS